VGIPKNKITAIIGPSGCGKSTLLKSLNRLVELVDGVKISGTVVVDGFNIFDKAVDVIEIRKKMGLIAQTPNPLPMSIFDNVAYGLRIHGMKDGEELDETVKSCLKASSLWDEVKDRLKEPTSKLSVGQQQRLCLARALAVKPEVILCDEATSALDPISARRIETQLLALKKDYTVVFVTHVLRQARRLADYVVFLYLGELIEHGSAEEFFMNSKNQKTKAYLQGVFS
ncbi:MAG: phosphate ABC transporter ATP-binding protein, partial [Candidatus Bathyarchaeota archaeon]|nr:phosphate ABC transporter ATP-binding protein [Candidatus Bathyarchaeota archaeon]